MNTDTPDDDASQGYFAYGSNLHPLRMAARLATPRLIGPALLPAHALRFDKRGRDGSGKCTIVPEATGTVYGALYRLSAPDRARLDAIEGVGAGYDACAIALPGHGSVMTYIAQATARAPGLPVFDWYLALVLAGARHLGFPSAYLAMLHAVPTMPDPDAARRDLHRELLERCARHPPYDGCCPPSCSP